MVIEDKIWQPNDYDFRLLCVFNDELFRLEERIKTHPKESSYLKDAIQNQK